MATKRGSYWKDPKKAKHATTAMKAAWAARRVFSVTWEDGKEVVTPDLNEVAKLVHRSTPTLRIYLARDKGTTMIMHDGAIITLRRIKAANG